MNDQHTGDNEGARTDEATRDICPREREIAERLKAENYYGLDLANAAKFAQELYEFEESKYSSAGPGYDVFNTSTAFVKGILTDGTISFPLPKKPNQPPN